MNFTVPTYPQPALTLRPPDAISALADLARC